MSVGGKLIASVAGLPCELATIDAAVAFSLAFFVDDRGHS